MLFGGNPRPSNYGNGELPNFNMTTFIVFMIFAIPLLAYVIILPGVRRKMLITTIVYVFMLAVGASLAAAIYFPCWANGSQTIYTQFRAHSNERILAKIGVEIGLKKVNVTLQFERLLYSNDLLPGIDMGRLYLNEGFDISGVSSMSEALHNAQIRGLPYPMLTVLEYFSLNQDAFDWGRHYRVAGHYTHAAISFAFATWMLTIVFIFILPHYAYKSLFATGIACFIACLLYFLLSPCELRIVFTGENLERADLTATFSVCFYLIVADAIICTFLGAIFGLLQYWRIYTLSTFLDAQLDEHIGPKCRNSRNGDVFETCRVVPQQMIKECDSCNDSINKTTSSGFESKPSSSRSSRSLSSEMSFDTIHDEEELEKEPNFTEGPSK